MRRIKLVGWVERSDTHHYPTLAMGIAALHPSYAGYALVAHAAKRVTKVGI